MGILAVFYGRSLAMPHERVMRMVANKLDFVSQFIGLGNES